MGNDTSTPVVLPQAQDEEKNAVFLNVLIAQLWRYFDQSVGIVVQKQLVPLLRQKLKLAKFGILKVEEISLGSIPLHIDRVKVYEQHEGSTNITMDVDINYAGDAVANGSLLGGIPFGIKDIGVKGTLRVLFGPLGGRLPFAAMSFFFLQEPEITYDLTGLANIGDFIVIKKIIKAVYMHFLEKFLIFPNRRAAVIDKSVVTKEALENPLPRGVLEVTVLEVVDVEDTDFFRKPDIFVRVFVADMKEQTKVKEDMSEAEFHEKFEFPLLEYEGTLVRFEVRDKDLLGSEDLGSAHVNLSKLTNKDGQTMTLKLKNSKQGQVKVHFKWFPIAHGHSSSVAAGGHSRSVVSVRLGDFKGAAMEDKFSYYALIQFAGRQEETMIEVVKDGDEGEHDFGHFRFVADLSRGEELTVNVYQERHDDPDAPRLYGVVKLNPTELLDKGDSGSQQVAKVFPIDNEDGQPTGATLSVSISSLDV